MGIEFLGDGDLHVQRQDASVLLEIKQGEWKLEQVKSEAERLFKQAKEAYVRSPLAPKPDMEAVHELCKNIVRVHLGAEPATGN